MIAILTIAGSIGLFLYSMKLMSEGLQKIVGDGLRSMLSAMTRNRFTGMLSGLLVTSLVQSSRATTVTIVSFVNAGIISLKESMAVIMGANVGTTTTTWIIALLGFHFGIGSYAFPLIALSLPLLTTKRFDTHDWGELLMGFALLLLSVSLLTHSMPLLDPDLHHSEFSFGLGWADPLLFLLVGVVLTIVVQGSSAAFTVVLLLLTFGWIGFGSACSLVIGANIGTCITPLMASLSANTMARRAAVEHLGFNLIGALWALPLVPLASLWLNAVLVDEVALALFHTLFNAINMILLIGFTPWISKAITWMIPDDRDKEEEFKLQFIGNGFIESGEMALLQVRKETSRYAFDTYNMFSHVRTMLSESLNSERTQTLFQTVKLLEQKSDQAEEQIATYLNKISPKTLSADSELLSRSYYKMLDEMESVADSIYHIACTLKRKQEHRVGFTPDQQKKLAHMVALTDAALAHMSKCLEHEDLPESALNKAYNLEDEINNYRTQMRNEMLELKAFDYEQATYFMDIINECERLGDFVINVLSAQGSCSW